METHYRDDNIIIWSDTNGKTWKHNRRTAILYMLNKKGKWDEVATGITKLEFDVITITENPYST